MEDENNITKERWQKLLSLNQKIHNLANKYFSVTKWLTNVSIALLGFYIALLLQLKFKGKEITSIFNVVVLMSLILSILVGLFYNFIYETLDITRQLKEIKQFYNINFNEDEFEPDKSLREVKNYKLKMVSHYWVGTHFIIFLSSIGGVAAYLIKVLFF